MHRLNRTVAVICGAFFGISLATGQVAPVGPSAPCAGQKVVRVMVRDQREYLAVARIAESVWTHTPRIGPVDVQVTPEQLAAIRVLNLPVTVMIDDLKGYVDAQFAQIEMLRAQRGLSWFANYRTFAEINARVAEYAAGHPAIASLETIGSSLQGNPLVALSVTGPESDRFPRAQRPQIFFNATQHAREWLSPMTLMYITERLIEGYGVDPRITSLLDRCELLMVPVSNPDGYLYTWTSNRFWRKNRRDNGDGSFGVDTNRNWGFAWGSDNGSDSSGDGETYRGAAPFSEPETQVLRDYILAHPRVIAHVDYHTYGQYVLEPWGYTSELPPDSMALDIIGRRVEAEIERVFVTSWREGQCYSTLYPVSGGVNDWVYAGTPTPYHALSYTIELRGDSGGFAPPPTSILPSAMENMPAALAFMEAFVYPLQFTFPAGLPDVATPDAATAVQVKVEANPRHALDASSVRVYYRLAGTDQFASQLMSAQTGGVFTGTLGPQRCARTIEYYYEATADAGVVQRFPAEAPAQLLSVRAAQKTVRWSDTGESISGWITPLAGDNATAGRWQNGDPTPSPGQPADDHGANGSRCWVTAYTGSAQSSVDVDGGKTSLVSPVFNALGASGGAGAYLSFWRWCTNNLSADSASDPFLVYVSNDLGATWTLLDSVLDTGGEWVLSTYRLDNYVIPSNQMLLKFVAQDQGTDSLVEVAIDDFQAYVLTCASAAADMDGDGFVSGVDFDLFVYAFQDGLPSADFDGDGFVTQLDFDAYVWAFENP